MLISHGKQGGARCWCRDECLKRWSRSARRYAVARRSALRIKCTRVLNQSITRRVAANGGEDGVDRVGFATHEIATAEMHLSSHVARTVVGAIEPSASPSRPRS